MFHLRLSLLKLGNNSYRNSFTKFQTSTISIRAFSSKTVPVTDDDNTGGVKPVQASGKQAARAPLAKNFFVGVVDKELLAFPEVIARDEMKQLQNDLLPLRNFFKESVDTKSIDATRSIPPDVMEGVRELGLFGLNAPTDFDGKGWQWSESLMASEEECLSPDIAITLLSHRVVIDVLTALGTDEQKQRFLPKLAKGSIIGTEAISEFDMPEHDLLNTKAEFNPDNQVWTLNGEKSFVVTGPKPSGATQLFMVIAQTQRSNFRGDANQASTIFLVDSATAGVKVGDQHLSFGCRGVQSSRVKFENVNVPNSCMLGHIHESNGVMESIVRSSRLRGALIGLAMSKNLVHDMSMYFLRTKQSGIYYNEMEINQTHLSEAVCATYAMESMLYMTAGLLDAYDAPDVALEAAVTKYFTLRQLFKTTTKYMDIIGPRSLLAGEPTELALRNAAQLYTQGESVDMLSLYIAVAGLQHAGVILKDTVLKDRNPFFNPMHMFKKVLNSPNIDEPKTKMGLSEHLHPSLEISAKSLEHSVARLHMCVAAVFTRYGNKVIEHHSQLQRLTEMITIIYAMFASLSRASRSYCIGLQLAEKELLTAIAISKSGSEQVKTLCKEVYYGEYLNNDINLTNLASQVVKSKAYFPVHPLTYNF